MSIVNIHEAKTHLSRLLDEVAGGAEVIIAKAGRPVARLVPLESSQPPKRLGLLSGSCAIPDDFDSALPEKTLSAFEGR